MSAQSQGISHQSGSDVLSQGHATLSRDIDAKEIRMVSEEPLGGRIKLKFDHKRSLSQSQFSLVLLR